MKKRDKLRITKDLTPKSMSCIAGIGCPAIFETNKDSYLLVGKKINQKSLGISHRVGKNEILIEVPKKLLNKKL